MYLVLPFVLPIVGVASGVGPAIGLVIGILAMIAIVYSIRRFWRADHPKRWHYTVFASVDHRLLDLPVESRTSSSSPAEPHSFDCPSARYGDAFRRLK